jgi:hypothetical protein
LWHREIRRVGTDVTLGAFEVRKEGRREEGREGGREGGRGG